VGEECFPRAHFGFACALYDDVEELGKGGEEGEDAGEQSLVWRWWGVYFVVENVVEEDF
jgi:hypothetical protein